MRRVVLISVLMLVACPPAPRVRADETFDAGACGPLGAIRPCEAFVIPVTTRLAPGTPLDASECLSVCQRVWCLTKLPPWVNDARCTLTAANEVTCGVTAVDCGFCWGGETCHSTCSGCCTSVGCCEPRTAPQCDVGGQCAECSPADSRCSLEACSALAACGGQLEAAPRATVCADADGGVNASVDLTTYCPDACNAMHRGELLACAEALGGACADGGVDLAAACPVDAGSPDAGCVTACEASRVSCEAACSRASYLECVTCAARCGVDFGRCQRRCG